MSDHDMTQATLEPELYGELWAEVLREHPPVTLGAEYAMFLRDDLNRLLIRLARYKFAARMLRRTDRVLEIGCGTGIGATFLAQHAAHVTGIDLKEAELAEARRTCRRDNVTFERRDLLTFEPERPFDAIVSLDVIEHMPVEAGGQFLGACARLVQPDGLVIIGSPSIHSYPLQGALSRAGHVKCYDQAELAGVMGEHFGRVLPFSMNDEVVHTGHPKMAWYYFMLALCPRRSR